MFNQIVVGLDGSDTSEHALRVACDLASKYGSGMHLIHVPQPHTVAFAMGAVAGYQAVTTMPSAEEVQQAAEKLLETGKAIAAECGQEVASSHVAHGDPADEIVAYAEKCGADLIVSGRRGLGKLGSLLQGSTSVDLGHKAKCACLSVV